MGSTSGQTTADFLFSRLRTSLGATSAVWEKYLSSERRSVLQAFLEQAESTRILFVLEGKDLVATSCLPSKVRCKTVYFLKLTRMPVAADDISQLVVSGELTDALLDQLLALSVEIFLPLVITNSPLPAVPEVVLNGVADGFHKFAATVHVATGQLKNQTILPLPPISEAVLEGPTVGRETLHMLELALINWTRQIKAALTVDPAASLPGCDLVAPLAELDYWGNRACQLSSIWEQLAHPRIKHVVRVLDRMASTYLPAFIRLCKEVQAAHEEAIENSTYLTPLRTPLEKLHEMGDFPEIVSLFKPILHIVLLIWQHSKKYSSAGRLVALVRQVCNALILQARKFCPGPDLMQLEPFEAADKLRLILKVLGSFKSYYFEYKAKSFVQTPSNPWRFQSGALFGGLDGFLARCQDVLELCNTVQEFNRLERLDIGGTRGRLLTSNVRIIHSDFKLALDCFNTLDYDVLDMEKKQFVSDYSHFKIAVQDMERRLASILIQAFDDCTSFNSMFKLLDSFEGLIQRVTVSTDLEFKHSELARSFMYELQQVAHTFYEEKHGPVLPQNAAPHSGSLLWVHSLRERITGPMEKLKALSCAIFDTDIGVEMRLEFDKLIKAMNSFEMTLMQDWCAQATRISKETLDEPLFRLEANTTGGWTLRVNFEPTLDRLSREVHDFTLMQSLPLAIPEAALQLYHRSESFRQQVSALELVAEMHNNILTVLLPVEEDLLQQQLSSVHICIRKGAELLTWKSGNLDTYAAEAVQHIKGLHGLLLCIKDTVRQTQDVLQQWQRDVMCDRKEGKVFSFEELSTVIHDAIASKHADVTDGSKEIAKHLAILSRTLRVNKATPAWRSFLAYVSKIVVDGLAKSFVASLNQLHSLMPDRDTSTSLAPMLGIQLELAASDVAWVPELAGNSNAQPSVFSLMYSWIRSVFEIGMLIKRIDSGEGTYAKELEEDVRVKDALSNVQLALFETEARCANYQQRFGRHSHLWQADMQQVMVQFLKHLGSRESFESSDAFGVEIAKYKAIQEEVQTFSSHVVLGWIRVDARPLKQALLTWTSKWIHLFLHHLHEEVEHTLQDLYAFMHTTNHALEVNVQGEQEQASLCASASSACKSSSHSQRDTGGIRATQLESDVAKGIPHITFVNTGHTTQAKEDMRKKLYNILACIREVQKRNDHTEAMFTPLEETVGLLQRYDYPLGHELVKQLEDGPRQWRMLHKKTFNCREEFASLHALEVIDVRRKSDAFSEKLDAYRDFFLQKAPFTSFDLNLETVRNAYQLLDCFHNGSVDGHPSVTLLLEEADELRKQQDLFELYVVEYFVLQRCAEELCFLKALWDAASAVLHTFLAWSNLLWDDINVENLMEECKQLTKQYKHLPKAVHGFEVYRLLEGKVKAMVVALPLVLDLHNTAMRDRHWMLLMRATGNRFVMGPGFKLGDLLNFGLHDCVDACVEIVDRAQNELLVEKALLKIEDTWRTLKFSFTAYQDTDVSQLNSDDALIDVLESDNLLLQNLSASKYVQGNPNFIEAVALWQRRLGTVDLVLNVWKDAQRKWQALESIFVGSADIRVQLPEESKWFDAVNTDYLDLMRSAPDVTTVVEACEVDGRQERLEGMLQQLEFCEKALQDYLETKRMAFPRFYFISSSDVLDILSKGCNPKCIIRHLPKCFDNIHDLEFQKDDHGNTTRLALGMYSGEGEFVPFIAPCSCEGPVEGWLQTVVDAMCTAVNAEFQRIIPLYDEKPRVKWILDNSAQNTIVVSRLFFTQEVSEAFETLEEGCEDALKDVLDRQNSQLSDLIDLINGPLGKNERRKLITLCTVDVHARDVVQRLIDDRVENVQCFQWQSQLRYLQNEQLKHCQVCICDADMAYSNEYIGNVGCLCITPLTDRCYITLTQAQRLILGGAPAGPAGTGKTETTKDLARALGVQCYVFNCSDQMDYKAMGQIFKGLSQTGAWACLDEFNRIPVPVLSVSSTQYKSVLDALRARKSRFIFEDMDIALKPSAMMFITMNPGYPGRAELPESVKALFRPVSMAVPDLALICEIMLMAEGFQKSKLLSRKFVILYKLCEDLLSKSRHYDWKLRAIKTTLYVAGNMKRTAPELSEEKVLLRALRDFNLGKLTTDDTPIFMGLMGDLFPKTVEHVPRAVDASFEAKIKEAAIELGYQADDTFCLKISQLREILEVRWSVFLLGPAGCGKSAIWRTLMRAQNLHGERTVFRAINPKAVTRNELYGYLHPQTREWREGFMSSTFRDMAQNRTNRHQWIVLDGDIDAEWIESANTVMDDNKMLTLASNERIPLTSSMRLLLEVNHMNHCSPATVSRGGVIFVNADDIGWKPAVESWVESLGCTDYKPLLSMLLSKYVDSTVEHCRWNYKTVVPLPAINQVQTLCKILEGILPKEVQRGGPPPDKKLLEHHFVFSCIWAFGGCLLVDKLVDYRQQFSRWWQGEHKTVVFPAEGTVFDYYVDEQNVCMAHWRNRVPNFRYSTDTTPLFVPTVETTRLGFLLDLLLPNLHHVMFVGNTGTGKTSIMQNKLRSLDTDQCMSYTINLNSQHNGPSLQAVLESPLEKKAGLRYGPPGTRKLTYFIDDMNMPLVDKYETQSAIELLRQSVDYHGWYDKQKILQKEVCNTHYISCMNPTAGSFFITPRMQRHFVTIAVQMPNLEIVRSIYYQILEGHLSSCFHEEVVRIGPKLVDAMIELHTHVMNSFLPSAVKFHYQFNLRDMSSIVQGLCRMTKETCLQPSQAVCLWLHECTRVMGDRLVNEADIGKFRELCRDVVLKHFSDMNLADIETTPLIFSSFMARDANDTPIYSAVPSEDALKQVLQDKLAEYNESNAVMDLVLFQQAAEHVCRIARILSLPCGHAMLVGVGGSGKQSLARLAAFLCGYEVFQIAVSSAYGLPEFRSDLLRLYQTAGAKGTPIVLLLSDNQIVNEGFLIYINDLLANGDIPALCSDEDKVAFVNAVRNEVKAAGLMDTPDICWQFFIERVRKNLHVILCFSPVGDQFRVRARRFPSLLNCMTFDWFQPWPEEALVSVARRFLGDVPNLKNGLGNAISQHMAFVHQSVNEASHKYRELYRRHNYTTPKSYLELISFYKQLLHARREHLRQAKRRLEAGVDKITMASRAVEELQRNLQDEQRIVEETKAKTQELVESIGQEKAKVDAEVERGREDEYAAAKLQAEVTSFQEECAKDLAAAEPIIQEAETALNSLDKASLGELKSFGSPAAEIVQVLAGCMILCSNAGNIPRDLSWNAGKKFMGNTDAFLRSLLKFDKESIPVVCVDRVEKDYISNRNFCPEYIRTKSSAAAGLCSWVINICKYFRIYQVVAPKRIALADANKRLESSNKKLIGIRSKVKDLQERVALLEEGLMRATEDKNIAIAQAERTASKAAMAQRLITGLAGEYARWSESIQKMAATEGNLVGDVLLTSSFVTYAGAFNTELRRELVETYWLADIQRRSIPTSTDINALDMVMDESLQAQWANEGLPTDRLSIENGAIILSTPRWPLLIDPQLQGIKWLLNREQANGLRITQQSHAKFICTVIHCIENGLPLLIENCGEELDPVLDVIIQKKVMKRGCSHVLKLGDTDVEYDPRFKLYLQTKLSNPHYKPEVAAHTTLVNFCVTEAGLEDQLLALVVDHERPDLQKGSLHIMHQLAEYTIALKSLEDNLLARLAASQGDILEDTPLIENLEETKRTAVQIAEQVKQAKETEVSIGKAREVYRPVAVRGSLFYFLLESLSCLDRVYHYSMSNFVRIMTKGMSLTPGGKDESTVPEDKRLGMEVDVLERIELLITVISHELFHYAAQGLFERHKLLVATQLCMRILTRKGDLCQQKFKYLLQSPQVLGQPNPVREWLPQTCWQSVMALQVLADYRALPEDLLSSCIRWKEWLELERPEDEPLPGDWKRMPQFDCLLLFQALRPDRFTAAMAKFVSNTMGKEYVTSQPFNLERSFQDTGPGTPILMFLSPGVDVAGAVEALGQKMGFTQENGKYFSVSLGQGQEPIAMSQLTHAHKNGGWVLFQNIHLTIDWTSGPLEKRIDKLSEGAHPDFRLFLSAEASPALERPLPISILQACVKLTNEPPEGLKANLLRAYGNFNEELLEGCGKQAEYRSILFALSFFHAALLERKKFGVGNLPGARSGIGWNMNYPWSTNDLLCCAQLSASYLEQCSKVPWEDLCYMCGEIMYGGHIVDNWDRRLANAYLHTYMNEGLLEGMQLFPGFYLPPTTMSHSQVLEYVEEHMPVESAVAFGLHPNAEIGFKLREAVTFCGNLNTLQPRDAVGEAGLTVEEQACQVVDSLIQGIPDNFDLDDVRNRVDELTPYIMVAIQEADRWNVLLTEMRRSLIELNLGLKGDLTMTESMECLMRALAEDRVPDSWSAAGYPSLRTLGSWMQNLLQRVSQIREWCSSLTVPKSVWLSGLFNPQSFLTAVKQTTARRNEWALDRTVIVTEVTKKTSVDQIDAPSRDGAFVHGLVLEGASWDEKAGVLQESKPKQLLTQMPIIHIKAVPAEKEPQDNVYQCPVYFTERRFRQEVFISQLRTKKAWTAWTTAGVCMFLDTVNV